MSIINGEVAKWQWVAFVIGAILFIYIMRIDALNTTWDGDAEISVFPISAESKNYRLLSNVDAKETAKMFSKGYITYEISTAEWPNGGELNFNDCFIRSDETNVQCTDTHDIEWRVELTSPPEKPESDIANDY